MLRLGGTGAGGCESVEVPPVLWPLNWSGIWDGGGVLPPQSGVAEPLAGIIAQLVLPLSCLNFPLARSQCVKYWDGGWSEGTCSCPWGQEHFVTGSLSAPVLSGAGAA